MEVRSCSRTSILQGSIFIFNVGTMKSVKIIFIALEVAMLVGVIMLVFIPDWPKRFEEDTAWMYQTLIVLFAINAVVFQKEQGSINWED